jgi:hypothetical protein
MGKTERESRAERIARERREMNIKPWQFAPSAVSLDGNPWEADPGAAGFTSWKTAQQQRREIHARSPEYFWDDCDDLVPPTPKGK